MKLSFKQRNGLERTRHAHKNTNSAATKRRQRALDDLLVRRSLKKREYNPKKDSDLPADRLIIKDGQPVSVLYSEADNKRMDKEIAILKTRV